MHKVYAVWRQGAIKFYVWPLWEGRESELNLTPPEMVDFVQRMGWCPKFLLGRRRWRELTLQLANKLGLNL